jgi:hypothetical protein
MTFEIYLWRRVIDVPIDNLFYNDKSELIDKGETELLLLNEKDKETEPPIICIDIEPFSEQVLKRKVIQATTIIKSSQKIFVV